MIENNSYYFRVSAKNSIGTGNALESNPAVVIKRPPGAPDSPFPLVVSDVQVDNCTLEWKPPQWTGGEDLQGYIIERKCDADTDWKQISELPASTRKHTVQNLYEGTEYNFKISATNSMGGSNRDRWVSACLKINDSLKSDQRTRNFFLNSLLVRENYCWKNGFSFQGAKGNSNSENADQRLKLQQFNSNEKQVVFF